MKPRLFKPKNLEEFHLIFRAVRSHHGLGHWFRGQSDRTWQLLPKAGREGFYLPNNRDLGRFYDWSTQAIAYGSLPRLYLEKLAIAQHHGLATRLLDWTMNPLVAAFFCCFENQSTDGVIYAIDTPEKLAQKDISKEKIEKLSGVMGFIPNSISPRVLNQRALFTVHCDARSEINVEESIYTSGVPTLNKILIDSSLKHEILTMLDDYGINKVVLFPDLDGLSQHINYKTEIMVKRT